MTQTNEVKLNSYIEHCLDSFFSKCDFWGFYFTMRIGQEIPVMIFWSV